MTRKDKTSFLWLGHGTFLVTSPGGKRLLLDPWVAGNPACPEEAKRMDGIDYMIITHGHFDHMGDALELSRQFSPTIVCNFEIGQWLQSKGCPNVITMNKGGTVNLQEIKVTMTDARHSSSIADEGQLLYGGEAAGYVLRLENGFVFYFSGDTSVFGDMSLIRELYRPELACLGIGDHYVMSPMEAAHACRLLGVKKVIPMHYGTFPVLSGTPAALADLLKDQGAEVLALKPGESLDI